MRFELDVPCFYQQQAARETSVATYLCPSDTYSANMLVARDSGEHHLRLLLCWLKLLCFGGR